MVKLPDPVRRALRPNPIVGTCRNCGGVVRLREMADSPLMLHDRCHDWRPPIQERLQTK